LGLGLKGSLAGSKHQHRSPFVVFTSTAYGHSPGQWLTQGVYVEHGTLAAYAFSIGASFHSLWTTHQIVYRIIQVV